MEALVSPINVSGAAIFWHCFTFVLHCLHVLYVIVTLFSCSLHCCYMFWHVRYICLQILKLSLKLSLKRLEAYWTCSKLWFRCKRSPKLASLGKVSSVAQTDKKNVSLNAFCASWRPLDGQSRRSGGAESVGMQALRFPYISIVQTARTTQRNPRRNVLEPVAKVYLFFGGKSTEALMSPINLYGAAIF